MGKVKNQHFVPQFYLRNFSENKSQVFVYDKIVRRSFQSAIDSIACDKYFYDHGKLDQYFGVQVIERSFSEFEGIVAPVIDSLLERLESKMFDGFEEQEKETLAEFLYYQLIRTRENRIMQEQLHKLMRGELLMRGFSEELLIKSGVPEAINPKEEHLRKILDGGRIENTLTEFCQRIWVLVDNVTACKFYTSDDPVVKHSHADRSHLAYELFLPLSPKYAIMVLVRSAFKDFESCEDQLIPFFDQELVKRYNQLQVIQSTRQVYSILSDFATAEKLVTDNPSISDVNRPRVRSMFNSR